MVEVEKELLGGQKLQGPETAAQAYIMLKARKLEDKSADIFNIFLLILL